MQPRITPLVLNLIILNVIAFFLQHSRGGKLEPYFVLHKSNAIGLHKTIKEDGVEAWVVRENGTVHYYYKSPVQPVTVFTYAFAHKSLPHIAFNMLALFFLGTTLEMVLGARRLLEAYLFMCFFSGLLMVFFDPSPMPVVGASGAISGLLVLVAYYIPHLRLRMMFMPFEITARDLALGTAAISVILVIANQRGYGWVSGISHFGHLSGMIAAFIYFHRFNILKVFRR